MPTSLLPQPWLIFYYLKFNQALDTKNLVASLGKRDLLSICHCVVLFQLHGGIVSHMQVLATLSSTVHKTKNLGPYHWSHIRFSCLFLRQWCGDVASGVDRHLDITFGLHVVDSSSLISILFREVFSQPYISLFHLLAIVFLLPVSVLF